MNINICMAHQAVRQEPRTQETLQTNSIGTLPSAKGCYVYTMLLPVLLLLSLRW